MPYRERVQPSLPLLVLAALAGGSFGLILIPLSTATAAAVAVVLGAAVVALILIASPRIEVDDGFRAGSAWIEPEFLGEVRVLDRQQLRQTLGVEADARAHLCHRAYAVGAIRVQIEDPRDPTPYWVVSSNHPEDLARALADLVRRRR